MPSRINFLFLKLYNYSFGYRILITWKYTFFLQVEIKDTESETLEQLLKYIYSDKLECDMPNLASSLMTAADKYNLPKLKSLCEESICNNIEVSNAADILVLAHMYEASNLKAMAVDFIMNNFAKVSETSGFVNITAGQHPKLLGEMFKTLMEKLKSISSPNIHSSSS